VSLPIELFFGEDGLLPVIAQDVDTKEVLMLAYANPNALTLTHETGIAHYYSRSRDEIWKKGETSGNIQEVHEIRLDCDNDAILYLVSQTNHACHTGNVSCFFTRIVDTHPQINNKDISILQVSSEPTAN
jgi:phosphoribosyl-AMP cyclohydrolase